MAEDRIVAVGLLTQREVELLGHGFSRLWPVDETPCFLDLLEAIDDADRELNKQRGPGSSRTFDRAKTARTRGAGPR